MPSQKASNRRVRLPVIRPAGPSFPGPSGTPVPTKRRLFRPRDDGGAVCRFAFPDRRGRWSLSKAPSGRELAAKPTEGECGTVERVRFFYRDAKNAFVLTAPMALSTALQSPSRLGLVARKGLRRKQKLCF